MRVLLKLILDCDPDAAWRAIRSPAVFREVSSPLVEIESLSVEGFPTVWEPGVHPVELRGGGVLPIGQQVIRLTFETAEQGSTRILHDSGAGLRGAVSGIKLWDHKMAVAPDPAGTGKTLYRDQLVIGAGLLTPFAWYGLWAFWQWRGRRLQQLAPTWAYDPVRDEAEGDAA
ncbi:hypothetical protein N1031_12120 [Herbiconiux moechotypicola]|uniref:SRPBCC family protein n=1 Tax=Herbiconiux moechotypicola TaxID=637393 RepID=A0ABN3DTZ7_9MICO|nr:hypothetical protein [Herbiconiux moechotypicola]MCS5730509.1 hypothetical protein [Herbiconiux moechotypicola]